MPLNLRKDEDKAPGALFPERKQEEAQE